MFSSLFGVLAAMLGFSSSDLLEGVNISEEEAAARRDAWRQSPEAAQWSRVRNRSLLLVPLAVGCGALVSWYATHNLSTRQSLIDKLGPGAVIGFFVGLFIIGTVLAAYKQNLERAVVDRRILGTAKEELREAESRVVVPEGDELTLDLAAVWTATQRRLDYYHEVALSQSRRSFMFGQGAAVGGFMVLLAGAVFAAFSRGTTGAIVAGSLGAVGAVLSGFISATFAKSQDAATRQLRDYFSQPLQLSRFLTAERLASQLPADQRSEVIGVIVKAVFQPDRSEDDIAAPRG